MASLLHRVVLSCLIVVNVFVFAEYGLAQGTSRAQHSAKVSIHSSDFSSESSSNSLPSLLPFHLRVDSLFLSTARYLKPIQSLGILVDTLGKFSPEEAYSRAINGEASVLDSTMLPLRAQHIYWVIVEIKNATPIYNDWIIQVGESGMRAGGRNSFIDMYMMQSGKIIQTAHSGYHRPADERNIPTLHNALELNLPPYQTACVMLRLERIYGFPPNPTVRLFPVEEFGKLRITASSIIGGMPLRIGIAFFLLGALVVMGLFYSVYAAIVREMTYVYFVCYILGVALFFANLFGLFHDYIFPNAPRAEDYLSFLGLILVSAEAMFVCSFLRLETFSPRWAEMLRLLAVMSFVMSVLASVFWLILQHFPVINAIMTMTMFVVVIVQIVISIQLFRTRQMLVRYMVAANMVLYGTFFLFVLTVWLPRFAGLQSPLNFSDAAFIACSGAVGRVVLFALGFGYRSKLSEKERLAMQEEYIQQLQRNEELQRMANQKLEDSVKERTSELEAANNEIERQLLILEEQACEIEIRNAELYEVNQELSAANEFKMKMLGIAAHDLKNPISNILLSAQFLERSTDPDAVQEYAGGIKESGEHLLSIIDDLLESAALGLGKVELNSHSFDMVNVVNSVCNQYLRIAEAKHQHIECRSPHQCMMQGDEVRIRQLVDNLLSNAVKYSPSGGKIEMNLDIVDELVRFSVRDSGPGLTNEDKAKLFGMFQRLSAQPTGGESSSGVGLASVKTIVELHGGRIDVESILGEGSTFIVHLPILA